MNILCINHEYPPVGGGGSTACARLSGEFATLGHKVTVLTCAYGNEPAQKEENGVTVLRVKCRRSSLSSASFSEMASFLIAGFFALRRIVRQRGPFDYCFVFFGIPSGPLAWFCKKRWGIPYSIRLGGGDIPGAQKRFAFIYKLISPFLRMVWKNADQVIANSQGLCKRAQGFCDKANFSVVCNGVDAEDFAVKQKPKAAQDFRLVTTARIIEGKGIQHVVSALPAISAAIGTPLEYTVIGDGPYRTEIENLAISLGVEKMLRITGMVPKKQVEQALQNSDVFVFSSHSEGMPNAVLEAMSVGLPVVMSNCEGSDELIDGNGTVVFLEDNIEKQLADAIISVYRDDAGRLAQGERSRKLVHSKFTWRHAAQEYLQLIPQSSK